MQAASPEIKAARRQQEIRFQTKMLVGTLLVLGLAAWMEPSLESVKWFGFDVPILCVFRRVTGIPCPGCGMTRAFTFYMHGDPWSAIQANLISPVVFLGVVGQIPYRILRLRRVLAGSLGIG